MICVRELDDEDDDLFSPGTDSEVESESDSDVASLCGEVDSEVECDHSDQSSESDESDNSSDSEEGPTSHHIQHPLVAQLPRVVEPTSECDDSDNRSDGEQGPASHHIQHPLVVQPPRVMEPYLQIRKVMGFKHNLWAIGFVEITLKNNSTTVYAIRQVRQISALLSISRCAEPDRHIRPTGLPTR